MKTIVFNSDSIDITDQDISNVDEITSWIESNTILQGQKFIWRIGIGHSSDMNRIATDVRRNHNLKHYKQWRLSSFEEAFSALKILNKHSFVFKSHHNNYLTKGDFIFVYKAPCESLTKQLFHKTLNY